MKRRITTIIAALVMMMMVATGCSSYSADVDQTAIEQDGYFVIKTDKSLVDCHDAGKSGYGGAGNDYYYYPAGQRTYSFTGNSSESELDPVPVVTSDGQTLNIPGFVKFTLTSDCEALYDFHKKVGVKYKAYKNSGWTSLLNDYLGVAVTSAMNDAVGDKGWQELYTDASARTKVEQELNSVLQSRINSSLGGDWIKVNSVSLSKPLASETLVKGLEAAEKAKLDNEAQTNQNATIRTKYATIADCLATGLDRASCTLIYLSENGANIPFLPVPQGGNVNYSTNQAPPAS